MKIFLTLLALAVTMPLMAEPDFGEITMVDGGRNSEGTQLFGIDITLKEGWHTYWRLAGQNGLDPVFDFEGSNNIASYDIHWPEPRLVGEEGVKSVGYYEAVKLVISMTPENPNQPIKLSLNIDIGVCDVQCVPVHRSFETELNNGYAIDGIRLSTQLLKEKQYGECTNDDPKSAPYLLTSHAGTTKLWVAGEQKDELLRASFDEVFIVSPQGLHPICS